MPGDSLNTEPSAEPEHDQLLRLVLDALHRTLVHYALWWTEVGQQLGPEECLPMESVVWERWFPLQLSRLGQALGFAVADGIPEALKHKTAEELRTLLAGMSANWLACDGLWFQAVEERHGLSAAQRCNDAAWSRFSPFEAARIKVLLQLPEHGGLDALEQALRQRLYANINVYTIERRDASTLILRMNDCRVQSARRRKGLADYPCKSAGVIEYTTFATAIDPRIHTECLGCPPDEHPADWYCAWRFTM